MRAFFVLGCESSGTRMMTQLLIDNGCYGQANDMQVLDHDLRVAEGKDMVIRRSVPHGGDLTPPINHICHSLEMLGYSVMPVVMVRQWGCQIISQTNAGHVKDWNQGMDQSRLAMEHIMEEIAGLPWFLVSYDALAARPKEYGERILYTIMHITNPKGLEKVRDANAKYYMEPKNADSN